MLFQEPHLDYLRIALRQITLPLGESSLVEGANANQPNNMDTSYFLAVSSDVGEFGGSLSVDLGNDVAQAMALDFSWIDGRRVFLDATGRCICLYVLTPTKESPSQGEFTTFGITDGSYVHTVRATPSTTQPRSLLSSEVDSTTLREAAERSIVFRLIRVRELRKPLVRIASEEHREKANWQALEKARRLLMRPSDTPDEGVTMLTSTTTDIYSLLNRQFEQINSAVARRSGESDRDTLSLSTVVSPVSGVSVLADVHPTLSKVFLLDDFTQPILRAGGASAMLNPITQDLLLLGPQQELPATQNRAGSPGRTLGTPSLFSSTGDAGKERETVAMPGNLPKLKSLLAQPEMTALKTPWSTEFSQSLKLVGFALSDPELPPVARVHLSTASAQVARDKVQVYVDASIKATNALVKRAQELMLSSALQTPNGYWSREQRNLLLQLGFAAEVMRIPCSKKPHMPSVFRVAAQKFVEDFINRCLKPIDGRYSSRTQADVAADLRTLADEQIAEFEYTDSLLYAPSSPLKSNCWPVITCEFLRFVDFHALSRHAADVPFQDLEGVSASLRQEASDFLRQRNQVCPMETVEETIVRRCKEILASTYLSSATATWSEDLRHFMLMLDFLPKDMKDSRKSISREVRDLARVFLELRAQGKDAKSDIARALVNNPHFRMAHRSLQPEHILQVYLLGFPCRVFEDGVDALLNFTPDAPLKSEMHRYVTEYLRSHDERNMRRIQRFKELLHSSYLCTDHAYWPKEVRMLLADENYFRQELSSPIHEQLRVAVHIRSAARYFVEGWLRDRLASLLASFPNAMVPSFPALSTLPDDNHHVSGNDDAAQSQWSMQDKAAYQKDTLREDTVGNDVLLRMLPPTMDEVAAGVKHEGAVPEQQQPAQATNPLQTPSCNTPAVLHLSVFRVDGAVAPPVDDFAPTDPSVHQTGGAVTATASVDLHSYLAHSNFAQGQLDSHSIRPVISMALLHSDNPESLVMASSAQGVTLVDHTWSKIAPQVLASMRGGLQGVSWTPVVMGSSVHRSSCSVDTNIHASVFQEIEIAAPTQIIYSQTTNPVNNAAAGGADTVQLTDNSLVANTTNNHLGSLSHHATSSRFGDPYAGAAGLSAVQPHSNLTPSFSPAPLPRPRPQPSVMPTYNRPGLASVRQRLGTRPPTAMTSYARPPPFSSASVDMMPTRPPVPRTPTRPNPFGNRGPTFSDMLEVTPPVRRAGQPIFSPIATDVTDSEILRMVKDAEVNAGIKTNPFADAAPMPWDRRRGMENISRARAQAPSHDDFDPVSIPASTLVDGVSLSNVAGRRTAAPAAAMAFDMRPATANRAAPKALSFDDVPVGRSAAAAPQHPWSEEAPRVKEEIELDEGLRTPSFSSRRRMRDSLTMSPMSTTSAVTRRRVETAPGLERYATSAGGGVSSFQNSFATDQVPNASQPLSRPAKPWETLEDQPAGVASRRQLAPLNPPFSSAAPPPQIGRPPLANATLSGGGAPPKLTSAERVAQARARREELQRMGAPTQDNTPNDEVVAAQKPQNPFAMHSTTAPPRHARPDVVRSLDERPVGGGTGHSMATTSRSFAASPATVSAPPPAARLAARNPFGSQVDVNSVNPPTRRNPFASASNPPASNSNQNRFGGLSDEEAMRQIREEQYQEDQRAKAAEEHERKRRQEQLVQDRLRRNVSAGSITQGGANPAGHANLAQPDGATSVRAGTGFLTSQPTPMSGTAKSMRHRVLCEASFSMRAIIAALVSARVDLQILHEGETAVSAVLQSEECERIRVFVVPPSSAHPQEVQPCAVIIIPLLAHNTSAVESTFSLCVRVHNVADFIDVMRQVPLKSLPMLQGAQQQKRSAYSHKGNFVGLRDRFALVKLSLQPVKKSDAARHLRVLDEFCDPFVSEARVQHLAIRFEVFNYRRLKARERIRRQGHRQHNSANSVNSRGINLFVSPLEIESSDVHMWPLIPVVRSKHHIENDDAAPVDISACHVRQMLSRQRMWIDSQNPLLAMRLRKVVAQGPQQSSATTASSMFLVEIEKLFRVISFGTARPHSYGTSDKTATSIVRRAAGLAHLYARRCVLFAAWVVLQHNAHFLFPLTCLAVTLTVLWVNVKSLAGFGLCHRILSASSTSISQAQLIREKQQSSADQSAASAEKRVALLAAVAFVAQKVRRLIRGDSLMSSAMLLGAFISASLVIWWLWLALTNVEDPSLTDRDRYLGLRRHIEVDYSTDTVTAVAVSAASDSASLASLELHVYTGYLLFAPFHVNPVKWVMWAMFRFFMRDPTLLPLHS